VGGFKNALFGGKGIFFARVTGPGRVYLQSLPFLRLADRISAATHASRGESRGAAGIGRSILGNIVIGG